MLAINRTTPFALLSSSSFARRDSGAFYHEGRSHTPDCSILKYGKRIRQELAYGPSFVRGSETNCIENPGERKF